VDFEWDEDKRHKTLKERNLDFADAFQFFDGRPGALSFTSPRLAVARNDGSQPPFCMASSSRSSGRGAGEKAHNFDEAKQ
jgi:hypothetical protein